jgi:hypothetical protein
VSVLLEFNAPPSTLAPVLGVYVRGPTNGPAVPSQPVTAPWPFNVTVVGSSFLTLNPSGSVTIGAGGEGDYDISWDGSLINLTGSGVSNRVDAWTAINGVEVTGTRRVYDVGNSGNGYSASVVPARRSVGLVAGDVISVEVGKFAFLAPGTMLPLANAGLLRIERVG